MKFLNKVLDFFMDLFTNLSVSLNKILGGTKKSQLK